MTTTFDARAFQAELQRLDRLVRDAAKFADPAVQAHTRALLQAVLALHGAGLERVVAHLRDAGDPGKAVLDACADDEVVSGLLLLHGLHPRDLDERVRQALDKAQRKMRQRGGDLELLGLDDGVVRLRFHRSADGPTVGAMRQLAEEAIYGLAPDVAAVEVEGELAPVVEDGRVLTPLPML